MSAAAAVENPVVAPPPASVRPQSRPRPRRQPRYHVVLWNDDEHTFQYVIGMLATLFGHPPQTGFQLAQEVDAKGRVVVFTTTREHAELKRDQIRAFGPDRLIARSQCSMAASIEAE